MLAPPTRPPNASIRVIAVTADDTVAGIARSVLTKAAGFDFESSSALVALAQTGLQRSPDVVLLDLALGDPEAMLARLGLAADRQIKVVAIVETLDPKAARQLLQLRIADFLLKPVAADDLLNACQYTAPSKIDAPRTDARIIGFLPASGGVGVTTLAIETALLFARNSRRQGSTCLVDLDFQQGACAHYLDLEPRLDLDEIEPRPERLDSQLLEVMISHHSTGLSVICAPNRPAEMRSFDPNVVTRLLDLVSDRFENVVLDMPRTWFAWTDDILVGSDQAYIVSEATVPGLRHATSLIAAIKQRLGDQARPGVIVNRFEQRMFASGLKRSDIEQALGESFAGTLPNDYRLVREAIDRGVPLEEVKPHSELSNELKKIVMPAEASQKRSVFALAREKLGFLQAG